MSVSLKSLTKNTTKDGVFVLKVWDDAPTLLSAFMDVKSSTKTKRSPTMQTLNKLNLLYVVQSKADRYKDIYKVGVSKGVGRLNEYVKMHGNGNGKCSGVYLIYLAGRKRADAESRKTKAGKTDADIVDYYRHSNWSNNREKQILRDLNLKGITPVRGKEWFQINDGGSVLKNIIIKGAGEATIDYLSAIEDQRVITPDDGVTSIDKHIIGDTKKTKGVLYYRLKWKKQQLEKLTARQLLSKKPEMTPYTFENLKSIYKERTKRNLISPSMGDDIVKLAHAYITKEAITDPSQKPDILKRPKTRSSLSTK